jgi:hypothetical protein
MKSHIDIKGNGMAKNLAKCEHLQPYLQLAHHLIHTYQPFPYWVQSERFHPSPYPKCTYIHTFTHSHWQNHTWNLFTIPLHFNLHRNPLTRWCACFAIFKLMGENSLILKWFLCLIAIFDYKMIFFHRKKNFEIKSINLIAIVLRWVTL